MNRDERSFRTREFPSDDVYSSFKRTDSYNERRQRSPHPLKEMMGYEHDQGRHAKSSVHSEYNDHRKPPRPGSIRHDQPNSDHSRSTTESCSSITEATHASSSSSTALDSSGTDRHIVRGRPLQVSQLKDIRKSMPPRNESIWELHDPSEDIGFDRRHTHEQRASRTDSHSNGTPRRNRSGSFNGDLSGLQNRNSRVSPPCLSSASDSHLDSAGVYGYKANTTGGASAQSKLHSSMSGIDQSAGATQTAHSRLSKHDHGVVDNPIVEESNEDDSNNNLFLFKLSQQLQDFVGPEQITSRYLAELSEKLEMPVAYSCGQGLELVTSDGIVLVSEILKPTLHHDPCTELVRRL